MSETIHPIINNLNAPFWKGANDNKLVIPHCIATNQCFWPPSPISPFVGSGSVEWREVDPVGTLMAQVVYRRVFQKAFESLVPYGIGLVELKVGPRLLVHIVDPDSDYAPKSGDRVVINFIKILDNGPAVPVVLTSRRMH